MDFRETNKSKKRNNSHVFETWLDNTNISLSLVSLGIRERKQKLQKNISSFHDILDYILII